MTKKKAFLKLVAATLLFVLLGFLGAAILSSLQSSRRPPYLRRLPGPRVAALPQFLEGGGFDADGGKSLPSSPPPPASWASRMLWGTYRSGKYLGIRTRSPRSLSAGLMWFDPDGMPAAAQGAHSFHEAPTMPPLRHEAQERDRGEGGGRRGESGGGLQTFGWVRHDGETYGEQRIVDFGGKVELLTTFLKREVRGSVGGDWALRVSAKKGNTFPSPPPDGDALPPRKKRASLLFYVADEGVLPDGDENNGPLELAAKSSPIEVFPAVATASGAGEKGDGVGVGGGEGRERGRRRRASAAAEAFSSGSSSSPSKPVVLASGASSHPVGAWKLSLVVAAPPEEEGERKTAAGGGGGGGAFDLRYLGRRRPEPGALLKDLTGAVAAELEVGAAAAAASEEESALGSSSATGLRRRKKRSGGNLTRPPLSRHALPNVVDKFFESEEEDDDDAGGEEASGPLFKGSNLAVFQLTAELPFEADFVFAGGEARKEEEASSSSSSSASPPPSSSSSSTASSSPSSSSSSSSSTASSSPSSSSSLFARLFRPRSPLPLLEEPLAVIPPSSVGAPSSLLSAPLAERVAGLSGPELTAAASAAAAAFDARFQGLFASKLSAEQGGPGGGLDDPRAAENVSRAAISNLLGGMAYFYGSPQVRRAAEKRKPASTSVLRGAPGPLFTATPSRAFFPRGFLWDEGFHQLVLMRWSREIARDALAHWCDAVTATGWIPREQILGSEAESRVPPEFVAQDPTVANPPTLLLPLSAMARGVAEAEAKVARWGGGGSGSGGAPSSSSPSSESAGLAALAAVDPQAAADAALLEAAYPRVKRWVEWLLETQAGGGGEGKGRRGGAAAAATTTTTTFRWRGRDATASGDRELNPKTLASGLDDYPRPSHPDEVEERHVDLLCWAALAVRLLARVAAGVGRGGGGEAGRAFAADAARFSSLAASLGSLSNLREHHWDAERRGFFDWGFHTDNLALEWRYLLDEETGYPVDRELVRVLKRRTRDGRLVAIDDDDGDGDGGDEIDEAALVVPPRFVSHVGYVSLFPFLLRLLPRGSDELSASLDQVEELLDPRSGLASLSRSSTFHAARNTEHDAPYWRGAVWPPMNYLALAALDFYAKEAEGGEAGSERRGEKRSSPLAERAASLRDRLRAAFVGNVVSRATAAEHGVCDLWERYDDDGSQGVGVDGRPLEIGSSSPGKGLGPRPFTGWGSTVALASAGVYFDI